MSSKTVKTSDHLRKESSQFYLAMDKISEALSRMALLSESAPLSTTASHFSTEGLNGLAWLVNDVVDILSDARNRLKKIAKNRE